MPKYDFEARTTEFAVQVVRFCRVLPYNTINNQLIKQIIRSSGSIGANYYEANDALGLKESIFRLRISRKETKETQHWLMILKEANKDQIKIIIDLYNEADELKKILSVMITKLRKSLPS